MTDVLEYKCPKCGGKIEFDSHSQKMKCPYCNSEFDIETLAQYDEFLNEEPKDQLEWDQSSLNSFDEEESKDMAVYICESCGGEIMGDATLAASHCPFCDNPVIFKEKLMGDLKPDYIIPFKVDKKQAIEALKNHSKGKIFVPKSFKDENHLEEVRGLYVPFWLFDCHVDANAKYTATRVRTWSDRHYVYTQTSHFLIKREGNMNFTRVPVDGSIKMDDAMMESIEPFNSQEAVDFKTAYLSGYLADRYDVSVEDSISHANERIKRSATQALQSTVVGYSTVIPANSSVQMQQGEHHYAMYPVWLLNTKWNGQVYTFVMNGQTGKFVGDLPADKGLMVKYFFIFAIIFAVIAFAFLSVVM